MSFIACIALSIFGLFQAPPDSTLETQTEPAHLETYSASPVIDEAVEFPTDWDCDTVFEKLQAALAKKAALESKLQAAKQAIAELMLLLVILPPGSAEYDAVYQELLFQTTLATSLEQQIASLDLLIALYRLYLSLYCHIEG